MKFFMYTVGTFFGFGRIPGAPGTWGSLAGACCFYFMLGKPQVLIPLLVALFFLGVWVSGQMEKMLRQRDPSCVVIDEVCGVGIAMLGIPQIALQWPYLIMSVLLFRIFDIWKPYPIRKIETLPGGWGVMCDDLLAGIYAFIWIKIGAMVVQMIQ